MLAEIAVYLVIIGAFVGIGFWAGWLFRGEYELDKRRRK